ncbi:MAG: hypothetical protein E7254_06605 [Lachnospiraceae bacterium]|nr:hypothetical protein [Lachnospiraceae bacterium]
MGSRNIGEFILKMILSFFVATSVFSLAICVELGLGFINTETVRKSVVGSSYVMKLSDRMQQDIDTVIAESGIPASVTGKLIDEEKMYIVLDNGIKNGLEGKEAEQTEASIKEFEDEFLGGIKTYLNEQSVEITPEVEESAHTLTKKVSDIFAKYAKHKMAINFYNFRKSCTKILKLITVVNVVMLIVSAGLLLILSKYKHHAIRKIMYGFSAAFIWNVIALCYVRLNVKKVQNISFYEYYKDFLQEYQHKSIQIWYIISIVLICAIFALGVKVKTLKEN